MMRTFLFSGGGGGGIYPMGKGKTHATLSGFRSFNGAKVDLLVMNSG